MQLIQTLIFKDFASSQRSVSVCTGNSVVLKCDRTENTNYTIAIDESVYAVKSSGVITCNFEWVLVFS